jgi:hypothetical protein
MTTSNDRETTADRYTCYVRWRTVLLQSHKLPLPFHFTELIQHYTITIKVLVVEYIYYKYILT